MKQRLRLGSAAVCLAALGLGAAPASAGGYCSDMALTCEADVPIPSARLR